MTTNTTDGLHQPYAARRIPHRSGATLHLSEHPAGDVNCRQRLHSGVIVEGQVQACADCKLQDTAPGLAKQLPAQVWKPQGIGCYAAIQCIIALCAATTKVCFRQRPCMGCNDKRRRAQWLCGAWCMSWISI